VEQKGNTFRHIKHGTISTPANTDFNERLLSIGTQLDQLFTTYPITGVAIESLFFNSNTKTAINVAQARGIMLYVTQQRHLPIHSYTPPQIKLGICGFGRATKNQVQYMVKQLLNLSTIPKPDDAADALAIAICHGHLKKTHALHNHHS